MRIGISTSVIQRGHTGIAQYVFALLRAFQRCETPHQFVLFVLEEDRPLFDFVRDSMEIVLVPERFRPPVKNIIWHQTHLPRLSREHRLDVLHVPSYRRLVWSRCCPRVATIHDLAPFRVAKKYDWKRLLYGRIVARQLARRQERVIAISENTAADLVRFFRLSRNRIRVVHNGLEHARFFPGSHEAARAMAANRHDLRDPFFLYVARLEHPGKNHVRLITAFNEFKAASHSNWQLVLAGADWHGAEAIHQAIAQSPSRAGHPPARFCSGRCVAGSLPRRRRLCLSVALRRLRNASRGSDGMRLSGDFVGARFTRRSGGRRGCDCGSGKHRHDGGEAG